MKTVIITIIIILVMKKVLPIIIGLFLPDVEEKEESQKNIEKVEEDVNSVYESKLRQIKKAKELKNKQLLDEKQQKTLKNKIQETKTKEQRKQIKIPNVVKRQKRFEFDASKAIIYSEIMKRKF